MHIIDMHIHVPPTFWRGRAGLVLIGLGAMGGIWLLAEHKAHLFDALPYVFLLACPLMHHDHGGHRPIVADARAPAPQRIEDRRRTD
jgi:hypothetical protein